MESERLSNFMCISCEFCQWSPILYVTSISLCEFLLPHWTLSQFFCVWGIHFYICRKETHFWMDGFLLQITSNFSLLIIKKLNTIRALTNIMTSPLPCFWRPPALIASLIWFCLMTTVSITCYWNLLFLSVSSPLLIRVYLMIFMQPY